MMYICMPTLYVIHDRSSWDRECMHTEDFQTTGLGSLQWLCYLWFGYTLSLEIISLEKHHNFPHNYVTLDTLICYLNYNVSHYFLTIILFLYGSWLWFIIVYNLIQSDPNDPQSIKGFTLVLSHQLNTKTRDNF
jgi:hypothetical protein